MMLPTRIVFGNEIIEIAKENEDFVAFNADTKTCHLEHFEESFPNRAYSFGIAEQNLLGAAAGMASCGTKVIVATYSVFLCLRACEQVRTYVCQPQFDVMMLGTHAGLLTGTEGASHIAVEDLSIMRAIPNLTIIEPSDAVSARIMAREAIKFKGPLYVRLHFAPVPDVHQEEDYHFTIGKANVMRNETNAQVTFLVTGILLGKVLEAAEHLQEEGIAADVIEFNTIKPLDEESIIAAAKKTGALVTVEDNTILGGFGAAVTEVLSETIPTPVKRIGILDSFGESGAPEELYRKNKMTVEDMMEAARMVIALKKERS